LKAVIGEGPVEAVMTANRWWVRVAARWLARVDGVSGMIRLAMLGLTGLSTATLTLRQYGHGEYAWPLIGVVLAGTLVFTYLYTEGGVWNQMARDRKDLSNNFAGLSMRMNNELLARGLLAAREQRPSPRRSGRQSGGNSTRRSRSTATGSNWRDERAI
jgi:hypothetical protein